LHLLATIVALFSRNEATLANFESYLAHLLPLGIVMTVIRQLALRRWRHRTLRPNLQIKPMILVFGSWPVYTLAWLMVLFRLPLRFRPTPKTPSGELNLVWLLPQTAVSLLLIVGLARYLADPSALSFLTWGFAGGELVAQLLLIVQWLSLRRSHLVSVSEIMGSQLKNQKNYRPAVKQDLS
jgi:hypothetical protein